MYHALKKRIHSLVVQNANTTSLLRIFLTVKVFSHVLLYFSLEKYC